MNKKTIFFTAALGIMLLLSGCSQNNSATTSPHSEKIFHYGTMAYGTAMQDAGINPHDTYCGWSTVRYGIGETLFRFNKEMKIEPWLAESANQLDDYTVKITLRNDITFSNGKKVTGNDVKTCLEDLLKKNDRAPHDLKIKNIIADGQTVTIQSSEKVPALLHYLADPYAAIIDMTAGEKDRIVVGTGPYVAEKVTDTEIDLKKNAHYWGKVQPKLDKIIVRSITDGDALSMAMQSGELDAAQGLPYASLSNFQDTNKYKINSAATSRVYQALMNYRTPVLQNNNVRKAIAMAINKDQFVSVLLNGNGVPAIGAFPDNMPFGRGLKAAPYDPEAARRLLAQAGYTERDADGYVLKNGKPLTLRWLTYTSRQELPLLAEYAQSALKEIGIKLEVNATDNYKDFLKRNEFDIYAKAIVTAPTGDPEYYFTSNVMSDSPYNNGAYNNPDVDHLCDQLRNTFDTNKRNELAIQIQQHILDDNAIIYTAFLKMSFVMKKNVTGLEAHPSDYYEITPELDIN
ncbi:ABC transporter substrate-binding protein [Megasphaera paucivorans]|uniref:Peptide/nickel transport system substrate-binding protein n=1 Tax=Megasphaera paucivorans TaxID=349095 RepID=A0A1G9V5E6_9FIRM|nr:ABC transporter substrate-binding protein [Megasphaera paucivorans]SDM67388.1 peptide/nickel transport system substrate-binding protein [Megasphaera paucivorans]